MEYGALTIDTCIFDQYGLRLNSGLLGKLEQFKFGDYPLLLSEIVRNELQEHIEDKINVSRTKLAKALKDATDQLVVSPSDVTDCTAILLTTESDKDLAKRRISDFLNNTRGEIVKIEHGLDPRQIIENYFASVAPFGKKSEKKSEFPDAIALMNLESWAIKNDTKIIAVSKDADWKRFSEKSNHIDVTDDLSLAISYFQTHNAAIAYCFLLKDTLLKDEPLALVNAISNELSILVPGLELNPEATSQFSYDPDYVDVIYKRFEIDDILDGKADVRLIESCEGCLVIEVAVIIYAAAECLFDFYLQDPNDKDRIDMGRTYAHTDFEFDTRLLITLVGNFETEPQSMVVSLVEVTKTPLYVDFGQIEPDWKNEE